MMLQLAEEFAMSDQTPYSDINDVHESKKWTGIVERLAELIWLKELLNEKQASDPPTSIEGWRALLGALPASL